MSIEISFTLPFLQTQDVRIQGEKGVAIELPFYDNQVNYGKYEDLTDSFSLDGIMPLGLLSIIGDQCKWSIVTQLMWRSSLITLMHKIAIV